jgi:hypothetical protein
LDSEIVPFSAQPAVNLTADEKTALLAFLRSLNEAGSLSALTRAVDGERR